MCFGKKSVNFTSDNQVAESLRNEFIKTFPPFIIYLATVIILLSTFKDLVLVGFRPAWFLIRAFYFPFIFIIWKFSKGKLLKTRFYELPLWASGLYITLFCTVFSFDAGGLKSDYIFGLMQFYFAIAVMPLTRITFFMLSLLSITLYICLNLLHNKANAFSSYASMISLVPLFVFTPIVYFITAKIRYSKIRIQNELTQTLVEREQIIEFQSKKMAEIETREALSLIVVQMAHDIRSPLAALNMVAAELSQLPENLRLIVRNAIIRINDIANNLITAYKLENTKEENLESIELLFVVLDSVISEKRAQTIGKNVKIEYLIEKSAQSVFVKMHIVEFKRAISNIINNALESIKSSGTVSVIVSVLGDYEVDIKIRDNGCGISQVNIKKIFQFRYTTKSSGLGLGLFHAKSVVQSLDGHIEIESNLNIGTVVTIRLPKASAPTWFPLAIELVPKSKIVILDDDDLIREVWQSRLGDYKYLQQIEMIYFSVAENLIEWHEKNHTSNTLYLCDYELIGQKVNGLEIIVKLKIAETSFLVTSLYENAEIRSRCNDIGLRIIPKNFAAHIPVHIISD